MSSFQYGYLIDRLPHLTVTTGWSEADFNPSYEDCGHARQRHRDFFCLACLVGQRCGVWLVPDILWVGDADVHVDTSRGVNQCSPVRSRFGAGVAAVPANRDCRLSDRFVDLIDDRDFERDRVISLCRGRRSKSPLDSSSPVFCRWRSLSPPSLGSCPPFDTSESETTKGSLAPSGASVP